MAVIRWDSDGILTDPHSSVVAAIACELSRIHGTIPLACWPAAWRLLEDAFHDLETTERSAAGDGAICTSTRCHAWEIARRRRKSFSSHSWLRGRMLNSLPIRDRSVSGCEEA